MDITITIDPLANGQTVYVKELDKFLELYIIEPTDVDNQIAAAQTKVQDAQKVLDTLTPVADQRKAAQVPQPSDGIVDQALTP